MAMEIVVATLAANDSKIMASKNFLICSGMQSFLLPPLLKMAAVTMAMEIVVATLARIEFEMLVP